MISKLKHAVPAHKDRGLTSTINALVDQVNLLTAKLEEKGTDCNGNCSCNKLEIKGTEAVRTEESTTNIIEVITNEAVEKGEAILITDEGVSLKVENLDMNEEETVEVDISEAEKKVLEELAPEAMAKIVGEQVAEETAEIQEKNDLITEEEVEKVIPKKTTKKTKTKKDKK